MLHPDLIIERLDPSVPMPKYSREGDSGFDLYAVESFRIGPHETVKVSTGLRMQIPPGYEVQIRPRSGLAAQGVAAQFGTVDCGYRGEIKVVLWNNNIDGFRFNRGHRIAQAVLAPVTQANIVEGVVSTDTERGEAGFGSTGR